MNSYQRVMNTLGGLPVDRLPVFAVLGAYGGKLTQTDLKTLFCNSTAYVNGQQALQDEFGFDLVLSAFDFSVIAEAFGGTVAWSDNQVPNIKRPSVKNAADALLLALPDIHKTGRLPVILDINRQLSVLYKEQIPIISALPGPCILPALIIGLEQWIETILFDEKLAMKLLEFTAPFYISWANGLLEAGADCLVLTEGMASAEIATRSLFEERCLPHFRSILSQINGPKVISSTGGSMNQVLDLLPGIEGLVGVISGSKDDLAEARRLLGPDLTIIGNLDNLTLPAVTAGEIYETCIDRLKTAAPSGHFILANAGADVPQATPPENLRAMQAACIDYMKNSGGN